MLIESFIFFLNILMVGNDGTASSISDLSVMTSPLSANLRVNISPDPNDQQNAEVIPYDSLVMNISLFQFSHFDLSFNTIFLYFSLHFWK